MTKQHDLQSRLAMGFQPNICHGQALQVGNSDLFLYKCQPFVEHFNAISHVRVYHFCLLFRFCCVLVMLASASLCSGSCSMSYVHFSSEKAEKHPGKISAHSQIADSVQPWVQGNFSERQTSILSNIFN